MTTVNVHPASLPVLLTQTLPITQHLASTFIFVSIFIRLLKGSLEPTTLLIYCIIFGVTLRLASLFIAWTCPPAPTPNTNASSLPIPQKRSPLNVVPLIPLFTLYLLSPALKTLTRATTSDSIWALSGFLFSLNLFLGDYRSIPFITTHSPGKVPSTLPLTAALGGSTVLASRLSSNLAVFSLLFFATLWFGPFPLLRSDLSIRPTLVLTISLCIGSIKSLRGLGGSIDKIAIVLFVASACVIPLLRAYLMIRYKDRIRGPWDQAVPKVSRGFQK